MAERLIPFDKQPTTDANVWLTPYISPCGDRYYYQAATEGEGYETQFFHVDGEPVDVVKVDGVWYWMFDDDEFPGKAVPTCE